MLDPTKIGPHSFFFQASPLTIHTRTLRLLVYNIDVNRRHRIVGQTLLSMKDLDLSSGKLNLHADLERYVKTTDLANERPEILLSICFNESISRLTVTVVECKHLKVRLKQSSLFRWTIADSISGP